MTEQACRFELYGMGSPNVRKITIMLEELGSPYDFRYVEVFRSGQFAPDFHRLNPNRKVPVLVDHGAGEGESAVIFESSAILIYLAEQSGRFLPSVEPARAVTLEWLMIQACNVGPLLGQLNHFMFVAGEGNDYAFDRYRREARRLYRLLDERLEVTPYLAGDSYSIADIATLPWSHYLERHGFETGDFPHLKAWRERLGNRAGVKRGMAAILDAERADAVALRSANPADLDRFFGRTAVL